ncbi:dihydrodipicolinate synthase family protein [Paraburkholderia bryophila]|uniref:dihydrodipicolinate synthase family protein n=1 Tax=Burkholderiaceae TaxID=119060 RepID=UPI0009DE49A2|nr:dihydrodipicolinate synthase family protein [Burkholderia sp. 9120]
MSTPSSCLPDTRGLRGVRGLGGVLSPVLTPFNADGTPSPVRFVNHCRWLLDQDVGLAVFGTNSEANSLTVDEKRALLDALLEAGLPPERMMPGTGACALPDAIDMTRHAVASGCAGVLMLPPFFYKGVSDEGLFRGFAEVIDAVADSRLRLYLYHIPPVSQVGLSFGLIERLLKRYPGVVAGIKDSGGDWQHTAALIETFQSEHFDVFAGTETTLLPTLQHGGAGCITATGNVNAAAIVSLARHWRDADAADRQQRLNDTRAIFQRYPIIAAMKAAIAWQSGDAQWTTMRAPLVELDDAQQRELQQALTRDGFEMEGAVRLAAGFQPQNGFANHKPRRQESSTA